MKATLIDVLGSDPDIVPDLVGNKFEEKKLLEKMKVLGPKERRVLTTPGRMKVAWAV